MDSCQLRKTGHDLHPHSSHTYTLQFCSLIHQKQLRSERDMTENILQQLFCYDLSCTAYNLCYANVGYNWTPFSTS